MVERRQSDQSANITSEETMRRGRGPAKACWWTLQLSCYAQQPDDQHVLGSPRALADGAVEYQASAAWIWAPQKPVHVSRPQAVKSVLICKS